MNIDDLYSLFWISMGLGVVLASYRVVLARQEHTMTCREAIAALTMLTGVTRVSVARVRPTDVIVLETPNHVSLEQCERMKQMATSVWPGHKVVVCEGGLTIKIVAGE